jgi:hypothetical protein
MIAEINTKILSLENRSVGSEDKLTGDFFGALRYIPFSVGIGRILSDEVIVHPAKLAKDIDVEIEKSKIDDGDWSNRIHFWDRKNVRDGDTKNSKCVEPDVLIELEDAIILIEVKLHSGLSSRDDDEQDNSIGKCDNQLVNEAARSPSRILPMKMYMTKSAEGSKNFQGRAIMNGNLI